MADVAARAAYSRPGGNECGLANDRPIDMAHLARQTLGDRAVEQEVLAMFLRQAAGIAERIGGADPAECKRLAHGLIGSARGVGAFAVADCAERITKGGGTDDLRQLAERIGEARDFIASISR